MPRLSRAAVERARRTPRTSGRRRHGRSAKSSAIGRWLVTCTAAGPRHLAALAPAPERVELSTTASISTASPPPPQRVAAARRQRSGTTRWCILSVGRAVEKKGYDACSMRWRCCRAGLHWRLVHIGGGPLLDLRQRAASWASAGRIDWRARSPQEEVLQAYRAADLFALACRIAGDGDRDGLPNVLMEAHSQGLACLSTEVSGIPELIIDGETGMLVPPDDAARAGARARAADPLPRLPRSGSASAGYASGCAGVLPLERVSTGWRGASAVDSSRGMRDRLLRADEAARPSGALGRPYDGAAADVRRWRRRPRVESPPAFAASTRRAMPARQARIAAAGRDAWPAGCSVAGGGVRPAEQPELWFTYHLYHKAPDLLGSRGLHGLGIPYVVAEASTARKRAAGRWALGYAAAAAAIRRADLILGLNPADDDGVRPLLADARLRPLPPFLDRGCFGCRADRDRHRAMHGQPA